MHKALRGHSHLSLVPPTFPFLPPSLPPSIPYLHPIAVPLDGKQRLVQREDSEKAVALGAVVVESWNEEARRGRREGRREGRRGVLVGEITFVMLGANDRLGKEESKVEEGLYLSLPT